MGIFRVPNFRPGYRVGTQIFNPGQGGPSGGPTGAPPILLSQQPRTGPNGNMTSMNGSGGGISGFAGFHFAGPVTPAQPGVRSYANQYATANQTLFIPGIVKNPAAAS
jgi:hypothetical protein